MTDRCASTITGTLGQTVTEECLAEGGRQHVDKSSSRTPSPMLRVLVEGAGESRQADRCSLLLLPGQPLEKSANFPHRKAFIVSGEAL